MIDYSEFEDKTILITGGTGSFGTAFCDHIKDKGFKKIILISSSEEKVERSKFRYADYEHIRCWVRNVRNLNHHLLDLFENVNYVIHAAAMKRLPICEDDVIECYETNITGTQNIARASVEKGVEKVLLISTDKAVYPINTYGVSKAAAERMILNYNRLIGWKNIKFSICRYGNVIGSAGSVLPYWRNLIKEGATSVPVTDERMTRFWFPMESAIEFVLDSLIKMKGDEIFTPKIPSIKIVDLAKALNVDYHVVGIRKGEKLHESLDINYHSDKNEFLTVEQIRETING